MNLYFLVEGKRTEMAAYPAFLSVFAPNLTQVFHPYEAYYNNFYIVSGFGYPNILGRIVSSVKDVNHYTMYDYLVICLDADEEPIEDRIGRIEEYLRGNDIWPKYAKIKIIIQKKCIESWFLGNPIKDFNPTGAGIEQFIDYYNVLVMDPERMDKPSSYRGSVGDFHYEYLSRLTQARGKVYTKRNPGSVLSRQYLLKMADRTRITNQMKTFDHLLDFCSALI